MGHKYESLPLKEEECIWIQQTSRLEIYCRVYCSSDEKLTFTSWVKVITFYLPVWLSNKCASNKTGIQSKSSKQEQVISWSMPHLQDLERLLYSQVQSKTHDLCQRKTCMCMVFFFCFSRKGILSAWMGRESWQTLAWSEGWLWRENWYRLACRFSAVVVTGPYFFIYVLLSFKNSRNIFNFLNYFL